MIPTIAVPRLRTTRLVLREFVAGDLDAYAAMCADAEVMRFIATGRTLDRAAAWGQMAWFNGHWSLAGCGMWALEHDGVLVGRAGFIAPPDWPAFEVGWLLGRPHWGRGLAREAVAAVLAHGFGALGRSELTSLIRPQNQRSQRLAEALGARCAGSAEFMGGPIETWRFARPVDAR